MADPPADDSYALHVLTALAVVGYDSVAGLADIGSREGLAQGAERKEEIRTAVAGLFGKTLSQTPEAQAHQAMVETTVALGVMAVALGAGAADEAASMGVPAIRLANRADPVFLPPEIAATRDEPVVAISDDLAMARGQLLDALSTRARALELQDVSGLRAREALGVARYEQATGRTVTPLATDEGADFADPILGDVDLKGPFITDDFEPLDMSRLVRTRTGETATRLEEAIGSIIREAHDSGSKGIAVDLLGLDDAQAAQVVEQVQANVTDKTIIFLR